MANSSGGSATAGGMEFQSRVVAWAAIQCLAEKAVTPPWNLSTETCFDWVQCETGEFIDDLMIGTSTNGRIFVQIKRTVDLSARRESDLGSTLGQFAQQFIKHQLNPDGTQLQVRPLDPQRDRFILCISPTSSGAIQTDLPQLLERIRGLTPNESIDRAAKTVQATKVLNTIRDHVKSHWQKVVGIHPSDQELRDLFSLVYVHVLDIEADKKDEQIMQDRLRQVIIAKPEQSPLAWSHLLSICANLSTQRSGTTRLGLQQELNRVGISLQAQKSYRNDIEQLKRYSDDTFVALSHLSEIRTEADPIHIQRECMPILKQAVEDMSLLIIGDPGSGKSGVLHDLVSILRQEERSYVFLAVDRLEAASLGNLRNELGLEHEVLDVLQQWNDPQPCFLIIDAFDAARDEPAAATVYELIQRVKKQCVSWRVIITIRRFDLRYNEDLQSEFKGLPPSTPFSVSEFSMVQHFSIPAFSTDEIQEIIVQHPKFDSLSQAFLADAQGFLRIPYNLKLFAELLSAGIATTELTPIKTQLELLNKYWNNRVLQPLKHGDSQEALLRMACEQMVKDRSLQVNRSAITQPNDYLHNLLGKGILTEWQASSVSIPDRYVLAFGHNILFDYACARLFFRGKGDEFVKHLTDNPNFVVLIRPSIVFHFQYLWSIDPAREAFWRVIFSVLESPSIPEIGKLIGPSVATQLVTMLDDLKPLYETLDAFHQTQRSLGIRGLKHLIGALLADGGSDSLLYSINSEVWCALLDHISRNLSLDLAYIVRPILLDLCDDPNILTPVELNNLGSASRNLLEFVRLNPLIDQSLVIHALQAVCRTFGSDVVASSMQIRQCLEPDRISLTGYYEIPALAKALRWLIPHDVSLVSDIYQNAFRYQEISTEQTTLVDSRITGIHSNRRQDYGLAHHVLAEIFPEFLSQAPENAIFALIKIIELYSNAQISVASITLQEKTFDFNGQTAAIRLDASRIWDTSSSYRDDDSFTMLEALEHYLAELATQQKQEEVQSFIQLFITHNRSAVLWRWLLMQGIKFQATIGQEILPLLTADPILSAPDTQDVVMEFLKIIFPSLSDTERLHIEQKIITLPDGETGKYRTRAEHIRENLLRQVSIEDLVTPFAQTLRASLITPESTLNQEHEEFTSDLASLVLYSEETYLQEHGVSMESETNRTIQESTTLLGAFIEVHHNTIPPVHECYKIFPTLKDLYQTVLAKRDALHPKQHASVWRHLAAVCAICASVQPLLSTDEIGIDIQNILLDASKYPDDSNSTDDSAFDRVLFWSPTARTEAAHGLITLSKQSGWINDRLRGAIDQLSRDSIAAVRLQIAKSAHLLYATDPECMWPMIERFCQSEASYGVLQGIINGPLNHLKGSEPNQIIRLTQILFDRLPKHDLSREIQRSCLKLFNGAYLWIDDPTCYEIVFKFIRQPSEHYEYLRYLVEDFRHILIHGLGDLTDSNASGIRQRAREILLTLVRSARPVLEQIQERNEHQLGEWPSKDQEIVRSLLYTIETIVREIHLACEYQERQQGSNGTMFTSQRESRFYHEIEEVLDELVWFGFSAMTTHYLLQTLKIVLDSDPKGNFLRIGRIVCSGQQGGYEYEPVGADLVVEIVESYLAKHRTVFRDSDECQNVLVEVLDIFVQSGWRRAIQLAYRLEAIFR